MRPAHLARLLLLLGGAAVAACSDASSIGPGSVITVRVVPDTMTLFFAAGQDTATAQAFPLDDQGAFLPGKAITWATDDPLVAQVDSAGGVTAIGFGTTHLTATVNGIAGTAVVNVAVPPAIGVSLSPVPLAVIGNSGTPSGTTVAVTNAGGGSLTGLAVGTITYPVGTPGWLSASLDQTTAPATLTLSAAPGSLALGSYTAQVPITSAVASNSPLTVSVNLTIGTGPATTIAIQAGNAQAAQVGSAVTTPPAVLVTDQFGNPVSGVAVSFAVASGGGSVAGGAATSGTNGIAAVTSWTMGTVVGSNTLTATSAGLTGSPRTFTATATVGAALQIAVSAGNGQSATVAQAVATDPAVLVTDQFSNPVSGAAVTFAVTAGGGSVTGGTTTTNVSGIATVGSWTLGTGATAPATANNTLQASVAGGGSTNFTATANPGAVSSVTVSAGNAQFARPTTAVATAPSARVRDAFGNDVCGAAVTFAVSAGGGSVTGANTTATCGGFGAIATVGSWTLGITGTLSSGTYANVLSATSNATSASFTASARYSYSLDVQPIYTTSCAGCHPALSAPNLGAGSSFAATVGVTSGCGVLVYVVASNSATSYLYQKLINAIPACGSRMPPGPTALPASTTNIIRDWIDNGAPNN
ncbi:MAG: hypothetical protein ABI587_12380 [Gemmatimonadales bacterium]